MSIGGCLHVGGRVRHAGGLVLRSVVLNTTHGACKRGQAPFRSGKLTTCGTSAEDPYVWYIEVLKG